MMMMMTYDDHWEKLNEINRIARPSKSAYDRKPPTISIDMQKQVTDEYSKMITILSKFKRFKKFLQHVKIRIRFFDDSDLDNLVEFGYAHTIKNIICLPIELYSGWNTETRVKLLIHESIHIYQRYFPFEFNKLLIDEFDLTVIGFSTKLHPNSRFNPDINDIVYDDDGIYRVMVYKSANPRNLADSKLLEKRISPKSRESKYAKIMMHYKHHHVQKEHPYEVFACILSEYMCNLKISRSCNSCDILTEWLQEL